MVHSRELFCPALGLQRACTNIFASMHGAGAELANVANEGALECGRRGGDAITRADIYNGIDRILQVPLHTTSHFLCFGCCSHFLPISDESFDGPSEVPE
jgi:hypothetical protein